MEEILKGQISPPENVTIVVVDDDPANRRLMSGILELEGYRTYPMASGEEGLAWMEKHPEDFDILITDVRMPGMNGLQLAALVGQFRPDLEILFVTGFSDFSPMELVKSGDPVDHILQKPFGNSALLRKVEFLLNRTRKP
ncbi:MAG: Blue-light-activated protein [Fibrobacteres bacterium]|nr:Blue-light-activated protein [Fibrobacterota bacterium]